jgi:hypothetical protein
LNAAQEVIVAVVLAKRSLCHLLSMEMDVDVLTGFLPAIIASRGT